MLEPLGKRPITESTWTNCAVSRLGVISSLPLQAGLAWIPVPRPGRNPRQPGSPWPAPGHEVDQGQHRCLRRQS